MEGGLESWRQRALRATTDAEVAEIKAAGAASITRLHETGVIAATRAQSMRSAFVQQIDEARIERTIALDPFEAALRLNPDQDPEGEDPYRDMDPIVRMKHFTTAVRRYDEQTRRQATEDRERTTQRQDDLAGEIRVEMYNGVDMQARIGLFARQLGDEHQGQLLALNRALVDARERASKATTKVSDGPTLRRLTTDVLTGVVRDPGIINRAADHDLLTADDAVTLLGKLDARNQRRRTEGESDRDKLVTQGRAVIERRLRKTGVLNYDAVSEELTSSALVEYAVGVQDTNRHPLVYAEAVASIYEQSLQASEKPEAVRALIPPEYKNKDQVKAAHKRGELSEEEAARYIRLLMRLESLPKPPSPSPGAAGRQPAPAKTR